MGTYAIDTGDGDEICSGLSEEIAHRVATDTANKRGEPVWLYAIDLHCDEDEDDEGAESECIRPEAAYRQAHRLIGQSVAQDEITTADHDESLIDALASLSDDSVRASDCTEFWGTLRGAGWRVHVRDAA